MPSYFSKDTFTFLEALKANNDKQWFNDHKQDYERYVREPALGLITEMDQWIKMISPYYEGVAKKVGGSLMRIHRDVRFSKDKSPYKTNIGIQFRHELGKDVHAPGFYLHIEPEESFVGVGTWHPATEALKAIRDHIVSKPGPYQDAIEHTPFTDTYELVGESLTRPPRGYDAEHPLIEEIKRKDFIALSPLSRNEVCSDNLAEIIAKRFGRAQPLQRFLCEALSLRF